MLIWVICVIVCIVLCIVRNVSLYCFVYEHVLLLVLSVLPPSDNSITASSSSSSSSNRNNNKIKTKLHTYTQTHIPKPVYEQ
jgi:hypothetical protein